MSRPIRINLEEVLQQLREGMNCGEIAGRQKPPVSREAIRRWKKTFEAEGKLPIAMPVPTRKKEVRIPLPHTIDLDEGVESLIKMAELAAMVPPLKDENWRLQNKLAAVENELRILRENEQTKKERAMRWALAQQQGELKPSLTSRRIE